MSDWQYFPLWWNCHDFAIRLAYLIVANSPNAEKSENILTQFLISLKKSLIDRVMEKTFRFGSNAVLSCFAGICILGGIFPSAVLFGTWCTTLFGVAKLDCMVTEGRSRFAAYNESLQGDFPQLARLHRKLFRGLDKLAKDRGSNRSNGSNSRHVEWSSGRSSGLSRSRRNHT